MSNYNSDKTDYVNEKTFIAVARKKIFLEFRIFSPCFYNTSMAHGCQLMYLGSPWLSFRGINKIKNYVLLKHTITTKLVLVFRGFL